MKKKLLVVTAGNKDTPSTKFRVVELLPYLEKEFEVDVLYTDWPENPLLRLWQKVTYVKRLIHKSSWCDAVLLQKRILPPAVFKAVLSVQKNIIFDIDDNIFIKHSKEEIGERKDKELNTIIETLRQSKLIICGNTYLEERVKEYNQNTVVIPTSINTDRYIPRNTKDKASVTIGWMGTKENFFYLEKVKEIIIKVLDESQELEFLVVSNATLSWPHPKIKNRKWSAETEVNDLQSFDLGLMPLTDDEWTKGKCAFKAIQYMSCGVPTITSPVGANKELVKNNHNGLLASTEEEWYRYLKRLVKDKKLREEIGRNGRQTIKKRYALLTAVDQLIYEIKKYI